MKMRKALHRHRRQVRLLRKTIETMAVLTLARRMGLRRGGRLLALATATMVDEQSARRKRVRGNEAPMIIWPRDIARLLRRLYAAVRQRTHG
jgi:hypothetical protein